MTDGKLYIKERKMLFEIMKSGNNEEVIQWYDENANLYDGQFNSCGFIYHLTTVETVCKVAPDKTAVILDVGAGSGVIGKMLHENGYSTIDAVDASKGMLKIAGQKNVYRSLLCAKIGSEQIQGLETSIYDVLVSGALFGPGTVYYEYIPSLMSHLKKGGHLIFSISDENKKSCPRLGKDNLMRMILTEWKRGKMCRFVTETRTYHINKEPASVFVLQKM